MTESSGMYLHVPIFFKTLVAFCTTHSVLQLTHWGRVTHTGVGNLTIIGSDNGLSPGGRQAIIWTKAGILLIGPLGTNFSEIFIGIQTILRKCIGKTSSAKWRLFVLPQWAKDQQKYFAQALHCFFSRAIYIKLLNSLQINADVALFNCKVRAYVSVPNKQRILLRTLHHVWYSVTILLNRELKIKMNDIVYYCKSRQLCYWT